MASLLILAILSSWVDADWTNQNTLTSSSPSTGGAFGRAVYTYGDYAIIGEATNGGAASIYTMFDGQWSEQVRLNLPTSETGSFGFSVGLEESVAVVGSPQTSQLGQSFNNTDQTLNKSASVYVYSRTDTTWVLQAKLSSLQPGADGFGYAVAVGGKNLVIGAPYATGLRKGDGAGVGVTMYDNRGAIISDSSSSTWFNTSSVQVSGAIYTYTFVNNTWISTGVIVPFLPENGDLYGWNFDISTDGNRLIIGAPGTNSEGVKSGVAYVYLAGADGTWSLEQTLVPLDAEEGSWFGHSVALDTSDAVIGTKTARSAYIFHNSASGWTQDAKLVGSDTQVNDGFGSSVAIYGTFIIIGAPSNYDRGSVYVWELDMVFGGWLQILNLKAAMPNSHLGACVSIGSRFFLAGAPAANHNIGQTVTMMFDSGVQTPPDADSGSLEDAAVLIRFSGDALSMDLLTTRKILSEAAGTGTAQTEVRIVDLTSSTSPVSSHLFGLKVLFTSSSAISALNAARNLLAALPEIRYLLNAAVGAVSGTAEMVEVESPVAADSRITRTQVSAVLFLVLLTIITTGLLVYFTIERRKKIAADQREAEAIEAEKEAKKAEALLKKNEKRPKMKRPNTVLRSTKRKDRSFLQAENDAAGIEFGETFFGEEEYPISPRGYDDPGTARVEYDPTESIENADNGYEPQVALELPDDGPRFTMDDDASSTGPVPDDGPRIGLDLGLGESSLSSHPSLHDKVADDGPRLMLDTSSVPNDGPRISMASMDDGPRLSLESSRTAESTSDYGANRSSIDYPYDMSIGPEFAPRVVPLLELQSTTSEPMSKASKSHTRNANEPVLSIPDDDGPKLVPDDGPSLSFDTSAPTPSPAPTTPSHTPDADPDVLLTPSRQRRPAGVPKLNLNL